MNIQRLQKTYWCFFYIVFRFYTNVFSNKNTTRWGAKPTSRALGQGHKLGEPSVFLSPRPDRQGFPEGSKENDGKRRWTKWTREKKVVKNVAKGTILSLVWLNVIRGQSTYKQISRIVLSQPCRCQLSHRLRACSRFFSSCFCDLYNIQVSALFLLAKSYRMKCISTRKKISTGVRMSQDGMDPAHTGNLWPKPRLLKAILLALVALGHVWNSLDLINAQSLRFGKPTELTWSWNNRS